MAAAAARRGAQYGKDFKQFTITLTPEEHLACKRKSLEYGVPVADVCRQALLDPDDYAWKRAKTIREQQAQEKEDGE